MLKKVVFLFLFSVLFLSTFGCCSTSAAVKKLPKQDKLVLFEKIYATPGIECNIYFSNIFLAINHANYVFDVDCNDTGSAHHDPSHEEYGDRGPPLCGR